MYKKIIFTLLIFLVPIGIIEQNKKDRSPQIINYKFDMMRTNNFHHIDSLFEANKENIISKKIVGKEEIYYLKNDIAHLVINFFITL